MFATYNIQYLVGNSFLFSQFIQNYSLIEKKLLSLVNVLLQRCLATLYFRVIYVTSPRTTFALRSASVYRQMKAQVNMTRIAKTTTLTSPCNEYGNPGKHHFL